MCTWPCVTRETGDEGGRNAAIGDATPRVCESRMGGRWARGLPQRPEKVSATGSRVQKQERVQISDSAQSRITTPWAPTDRPDGAVSLRNPRESKQPGMLA